MRVSFVLVLAGATLGACATQPGGTPGAAANGQPSCSTTFPDDRLISVALTDKFNGRYRSGSRLLDVWREGQRMFIGTASGPRTQLRRSEEALEQFRDGCGRVYTFLLPPDGPGGWLTITDANGTRTEWRR